MCVSRDQIENQKNQNSNGEVNSNFIVSHLGVLLIVLLGVILGDDLGLLGRTRLVLLGPLGISV